MALFFLIYSKLIEYCPLPYFHRIKITKVKLYRWSAEKLILLFTYESINIIILFNRLVLIRLCNPILLRLQYIKCIRVSVHY